MAVAVSCNDGRRMTEPEPSGVVVEVEIPEQQDESPRATYFDTPDVAPAPAEPDNASHEAPEPAADQLHEAE